MALTIEICESNGGTPTITHNITNMNFGASDAANLTRSSSQIPRTGFSYEKKIRLHVSDLGGLTSVSDIRVWKAKGTLGTGVTVDSNARTASYGGAPTYDAPSDSDSAEATQTFPTTYPSGANLGIAGSLSGSLTAAGYSDYLVAQITTSTATYDEENTWYITFRAKVIV